jgi:glycosyltransferase involved in cell wall biosynthesis
MIYKTLRELRVSVVHPETKRVAFGDNLRVTNILELISNASFQVSDVRVPVIDRNYLSTYDGLRNILLNILPPHKSTSMSLNFSRENIIRNLGFVVSLNHIVRVFRRLKPDIVMAETSPVGWVTSVVAKQLSIPCVIDVHGLAFAEAKGRGSRNWQQIMNLEKEAFENCDQLIVVSEKMKEYMSKQFNISNKKMVVAPNGSTVQQLTAKYETPLNVIYAGIFSYWEKVHDFLDIAKHANSTMFNFYLAGAGSLKNQLVNRIRKEKIPVTYLGYIPKRNMHTLLAKMQIGIAPSTRDLARQVASPIKIFDYLASGLPVITPRIGDWGDFVASEYCGIALEDDTIDKYVEALNILASKDTWTTMSRNALKLIEDKYSWDKVLWPIVNLIERTYK